MDGPLVERFREAISAVRNEISVLPMTVTLRPHLQQEDARTMYCGILFLWYYWYLTVKGLGDRVHRIALFVKGIRHFWQISWLNVHPSQLIAMNSIYGTMLLSYGLARDPTQAIDI